MSGQNSEGVLYLSVVLMAVLAKGARAEIWTRIPTEM